MTPKLVRKDSLISIDAIQRYENVPWLLNDNFFEHVPFPELLYLEHACFCYFTDACWTHEIVLPNRYERGSICRYDSNLGPPVEWGIEEQIFVLFGRAKTDEGAMLDQTHDLICR
jgi:hypothetical protein